MTEWFKVQRRPVTQRAREANPGGELIVPIGDLRKTRTRARRAAR